MSPQQPGRALSRIRIALVALLLAGWPLAAVGQTLVFTAIPDEDETRLQERFDAVADYLSEQLDVNVRYVPVKSYGVAVTAFRNNQVQLAWFGGLSGIRARDAVPGSKPLAQGVEDAAFRNYFIVHRSVDVERSDDELPEGLRGLRFTFGSSGSTSGRLIPEYHIRQRFGESPNRVFSRVGYSGNHTRTLALVESGSYEAGALNYAVWEDQVAKGNVDTDAVRVIWETPTFSNYQWTIRGDADERFGDGFTERVQKALLEMDDPDLLNRFPRSGFIPVKESDYDALRETARGIGLID